jgi:predicted metalloprotease with PDZ domain
VDTLHDSFVGVGAFEHTQFTVHGVVHHHWIEPGHDGDLARMNVDLERIVRTASGLFGDTLPYPRYDFLTLTMAKGHGGLEHKDGCVCLRPRTSFSQPRDYEEFLTLAAHEHFHAWNVKRIHPDSLGPRFDYAREHYTRDLWWLEGGTVFYEERIAFRAGILDRDRHLERLADLAQRVMDSAGARHQSLEDSSFDAWIKLYRPGEDSGNSTLSYYVKGAVVCLALELELLRRTSGQRGIDDLLTALWERWGRHGTGFPERAALRDVALELAGGDPDFARWFDAHVRGTEPVRLAHALDHAGIDLQRAPARAGSVLGIELDGTNGVHVTSVREDGPGAGILSPGDEFLALGGLRTATVAAVGDRLKATRPGTTLNVTLARDGVLRTVDVVTAAPPPGALRLVLRDTVDTARAQVRDAFLR